MSIVKQYRRVADRLRNAAGDDETTARPFLAYIAESAGLSNAIIRDVYASDDAGLQGLLRAAASQETASEWLGSINDALA